MDSDREKSELQFCSPSAIEHVGTQLTSADAPQPLAFLVMSGAFNPVHADHVSMLNIAKTHAESLGLCVVGGFLAPSNDAYVQSKCGVDALTLPQRQILCEAAIEGSQWLNVCAKGELSSNLVSWEIRRELESALAHILRGRSLTSVELMGSDTVVRIFEKILARDSAATAGAQRGRVVHWFLRAGDDRARHEIESDIAPRAARLGVELLAVDPGPGGPALRGISSNEIRRLASDGRWQTLQSNGWLTPSVLQLLEEWRTLRNRSERK
jgi:hypothetical protein